MLAILLSPTTGRGRHLYQLLIDLLVQRAINLIVVWVPNPTGCKTQDVAPPGRPLFVLRMALSQHTPLYHDVRVGSIGRASCMSTILLRALFLSRVLSYA